jgi:PKD repeat protein
MLSFKKILFLIFTLILLSSALYSTIINVPADQPTIQAGIDVAIDADTVLVQPGVYYENIVYNGKLITIGSLFLTTQDPAYITSTIIDGSNSDTVVSFVNGEDLSAVLSGFTITNGYDCFAGGIKCYGSSPTLENLIVIGNTAYGTTNYGEGGGIFFHQANSNIENVIIQGNSAGTDGGGVYCRQSSLSLQNVTIIGNTANDNGAGLYCISSDPILENVTISGNSAAGNGGGIYGNAGNITSLVNCIIWDNSPDEIYFCDINSPNSITISYSDIEGGEAGIVTNNNCTVNWLAGNININPLFVNPSSGDYHLQSTSPCIDAGDPSSPLDPDGTTADMGAFYFHQAPVADFTADTTIGVPPLTVNFTDLSTQGIGVIDEWYWDFGDGNNSSQQNPTNEYQDLGNYTVTLTVTNIYDFTDTITKVNYITVSPPAYNGPVWHISTTSSDEWGNGSEELPFATIQHGIDVSADTDTVLVQPGTYVENVHFDGDLVTVGSLFLTTQDEDYISFTIIDGDNSGSVVFFGYVNSSTVLSGFTITNGYNSGDGGGINCFHSSPCLENLIITGNSTVYNGGGIRCGFDSNPLIKNVTISDNSAAQYCGGLLCQASSPILENVTISGNSANNTGGGIFCYEGANPSLINCIMWNDSPEEIYFHDDLEPNSITIAYSDIEGGEAGIVTNGNGTVNWLDGNINTDPLFVDAGNGDYHLQPTSPCIDAGDPTSPLDPDGTTADMGAWFYNQGSAIEDNEIQHVNFNLSNYPNPFNPLTTIKFNIKENEVGVLSIFNIKGQLLESHRFEAGEHNFQWDASDMSSGVYLYKLQTENNTVNKKMLLLK